MSGGGAAGTPALRLKELDLVADRGLGRAGWGNPGRCGVVGLAGDTGPERRRKQDGSSGANLSLEPPILPVFGLDQRHCETCEKSAKAGEERSLAPRPARWQKTCFLTCENEWGEFKSKEGLVVGVS